MLQCAGVVSDETKFGEIEVKFVGRWRQGPTVRQGKPHELKGGVLVIGQSPLAWASVKDRRCSLVRRSVSVCKKAAAMN